MIPLLETHDLTLHIANHLVCKNLSWRVNPGEIWGILGRNGRGKTTLLQTLGRLHPPTHGEIRLQGTAFSQLSSKQIAQQIGFLFQETDVSFAPSVFDYCLAGRYPHLARFQRESPYDIHLVQQALTTLDLLPRAQQPANILSGGEKQRLAIATLLAQAPQLFLLDEPLNHLDWHYQVKIIALFRSLAKEQQAGLILSLHDINWVEHLCDHVILLFDEGEISLGTTSTLLTEDNLSRLFGHSVRNINDSQTRYWLPV